MGSAWTAESNLSPAQSGDTIPAERAGAKGYLPTDDFAAAGHTHAGVYDPAGSAAAAQAAAEATAAAALAAKTHAASDIVSGTLAHERGGLESDVSAADGIPHITGGATSIIAPGTSGQVLTSTGAGSAPTFQAAAGGGGGDIDFFPAPSSPSAYDDEFDSGTLDPKWTATGFASGTIVPGGRPAANTYVYDLSSLPGSICFQGYRVAGLEGGHKIDQTCSPSTNAIFAMMVRYSSVRGATGSHGNLALGIRKSGSGQDILQVYIDLQDQTSAKFAHYLDNGGSVTTGSQVCIPQDGGAVIIGFLKTGNVYSPFWSTLEQKSPILISTTLTKTGVTALDQIYIDHAVAGSTTAPISIIEWFRYYDSTNDLSLLWG